MKRLTSHQITTAASIFAFLSTCLPLPAQVPTGASIQVRTPGAIFSPERAGVTVDDVAGGRRFRGRPGAKVTVRGALRLPRPNAGEPQMQRLVIHFRTSPSGPSLRAVEVRNGSNSALRIDTNLEGNYSARETTTPDILANTWTWTSPVPVSEHTVIRLEIQFPIGFDSPIDPGEFVLLDAAADFPRRPAAPSQLPAGVRTENLPPRARSTPQAPAPSAAPGIIYSVGNNGELLWHHHLGHEDGSFRWTTPVGRPVGTGWGFKHVFSGGEGVIYAITPGGDLFWYRHDGRADGSFRWTAPEGKKVGTGWNFERVFSGGEGVIYAITAGGDLLWYRHDGRGDGSFRWAAPEGRKVGTGWNFKHVFSGGGGVIYAVTGNDDLLWYRHDGRGDGTFQWASSAGKTIGTGWNFKQVFSSGGGVIYAVTGNDDLLWYRHDGRGDGTFLWAAPEGKKVGHGWTFKSVFSGAGPGS